MSQSDADGKAPLCAPSYLFFSSLTHSFIIFISFGSYILEVLEQKQSTHGTVVPPNGLVGPVIFNFDLMTMIPGNKTPFVWLLPPQCCTQSWRQGLKEKDNLGRLKHPFPGIFFFLFSFIFPFPVLYSAFVAEEEQSGVVTIISYRLLPRTALLHNQSKLTILMLRLLPPVLPRFKVPRLPRKLLLPHLSTSIYQQFKILIFKFNQKL